MLQTYLQNSRCYDWTLTNPPRSVKTDVSFSQLLRLPGGERPRRCVCEPCEGSPDTGVWGGVLYNSQANLESEMTGSKWLSEMTIEVWESWHKNQNNAFYLLYFQRNKGLF